MGIRVCVINFVRFNHQLYVLASWNGQGGLKYGPGGRSMHNDIVIDKDKDKARSMDNDNDNDNEKSGSKYGQ